MKECMLTHNISKERLVKMAEDLEADETLGCMFGCALALENVV